MADEFLSAAIEEAKKGRAEGGIPIGSVLVHRGRIIGRGHNRRVQKGSAIAARPYFRGSLPRSLVIVGAICASVPDADVGAFGLGIPYEHPLGHRGFTHSLLFAFAFSAFATFAYRRLARETPSARVVFAF